MEEWHDMQIIVLAGVKQATPCFLLQLLTHQSNPDINMQFHFSGFILSNVIVFFSLKKILLIVSS